MGERTTAPFDAVGVLSKPPEERGECRESVAVAKPTFPNAHEAHICYKTASHAVHRCWTCTHTWKTP